LDGIFGQKTLSILQYSTIYHNSTMSLKTALKLFLKSKWTAVQYFLSRITVTILTKRDVGYVILDGLIHRQVHVHKRFPYKVYYCTLLIQWLNYYMYYIHCMKLFVQFLLIFSFVFLQCQKIALPKF